MTEQDKHLLEIYILGFNHHLDDAPIEMKFDKSSLYERAYLLGREAAKIGDDVRSVDYQTNEEILKDIYGNSN